MSAFRVHSNQVTCIKITQQKNQNGLYFIVTGSRDKTIAVWDFTSGSCVFTLEGHEGWVRDIVLLNDLVLVSVAEDKTL